MTTYDQVKIKAYLRLVEKDCLKAYADASGRPTVGIGHTGPDVHLGEVITSAQDDALLEHDLAPIFALLDKIQLANLETEPDPNRNSLIGSTSDQNLAAASFAFNCGLGALHEVMNGQARIEHFIHDHAGNVQPGLVARRRFELALLAMDVTVLDNPQAIPAKQEKLAA